MKSVEMAVCNEFRLIKSVCRIYSTGTSFQVLTDNEQYDDVLMDKLLEREWEVHAMYPELALTFDYPPAGTLLYSTLIYDRSANMQTGEA